MFYCVEICDLISGPLIKSHIVNEELKRIYQVVKKLKEENLQSLRRSKSYFN